MRAIEALAGAKLHRDEQDLVREAADALFFCEDLGADSGAREALDRVQTLLDHMVDSDRLLPETAGTLTADLEACGPLVHSA